MALHRRALLGAALLPALPLTARAQAFPTQPLRLIPPGDGRYCGLATLVVREQGEPEVFVPSPSP